MDKLIIVGAGDLGREVLQWALQSDDHNKIWSIAGFLDDNSESLEGKNVGYPILGPIRDWRPKNDEKYIVSIRAPKQLEKIVGYLTDNNAQFVNIIHRSVIIASTVNLGQGVILCPNVVVSDNAIIESHSVVNIGSCIGHDVKIGEFSSFILSIKIFDNISSLFSNLVCKIVCLWYLLSCNDKDLTFFSTSNFISFTLLRSSLIATSFRYVLSLFFL